MASALRRITLFTRPSCRLCKSTRSLIQSVIGRMAPSQQPLFRIVNIDWDHELSSKIPVVEVDGTQLRDPNSETELVDALDKSKQT